MCVGSPTAGTSSSSRSPPDSEFETDRRTATRSGASRFAHGCTRAGSVSSRRRIARRMRTPTLNSSFAQSRRNVSIADSVRREPFRGAVAECVAHYHRERSHQGLGNELIELPPEQERVGRIRRRSRLGGCSTTTPEQRDRIQFSVSAQARDTTGSPVPGGHRVDPCPPRYWRGCITKIAVEPSTARTVGTHVRPPHVILAAHTTSTRYTRT